MRKQYRSPEMELLIINPSDIITLSDNSGSGGTGTNVDVGDTGTTGGSGNWGLNDGFGN